MDTTHMTLAELQRLLHARELSAKDLLSEHMMRIENVDVSVKAFLRTTPQLASEQAAAADRALKAGEAGPLAGIPLAVKDTEDASGFPTAGSRHPETSRPARRAARNHPLEVRR